MPGQPTFQLTFQQFCILLIVFAFLRYDQNTYHWGTYKCEYEQNEPTNQHNYGIVAFGDLRMAESAVSRVRSAKMLWIGADLAPKTKLRLDLIVPRVVFLHLALKENSRI